MGRPRYSEDPHNSKRASVNGVRSPNGKVKKKTKPKKPKLGESVLQPRGQSQSCHQCRQSIHSNKGVTEVKQGKERLKCSTCTRFWCEQCLMNRYGVVKDEADPATWSCPVCERKCNCSLCRKKEGKLATGILTPLVKNSGFECVSEFLDKGTNDIAKVLQWKSPDPAVMTEKSKKKSPPANSESRRSVNKKRTTTSNSTKKLSTNSTNSIDSPNGSHSDDCCQGDEPCSQDDGRSKRRKLTHSQYSITIEDDPDYQHGSDNADTDTQLTNGISASPDRESRRVSTPRPRRGARVSESSPKNIDNEQKCDGTPNSVSPYRRSSRKRKQVELFKQEDFRRDSYSPESPLRSRRSSSERSVRFRSPIASFKSPEENISVLKLHCQNKSEDVFEKEQELANLCIEQVEAMRQKKSDYKRTIQEEKDKAKEERQCQRQLALEEKARERALKVEQRRKSIEERTRYREELKINKMRAQEKMKLAQGVKKQARKEMRRLQREREKLRKQDLLAELKAKNKEEKQKKIELVTASLHCVEVKASQLSLVDDSPDVCEKDGIPSLPPLQPLTFPKNLVPCSLIAQFLFVSEFLLTFSEVLGLKRKMCAADLCKAMAAGRGMADVYLALLKTLVDEDSHLKKDLKPPKRQKDLEQIAKVYLQENNINGESVPHKIFHPSCLILKGYVSSPPSLETPTFEESIILLDHLCHEALASPVIIEHLESSKDQLNRLKREHRVREKEVTKRIGECLKQTCDEGGTLEEIERKREEFIQELKNIKETFQKELSECGGTTRNTFLGTDRYNRKYWKLQSVRGFVVESDHEPLSRPTPEEPSAESSLVQWAVIDDPSLLEKLLARLHPNGCREKPLYDSLISLKNHSLAS